MKKGAMHLDWVISIAIFLIYILFFFLFISPFYKSPTQEGVIMLDILEDNLREEIYWDITKMPIFIDCDACEGSPDGEDFCLPSFPFEWDESDIMIIDNAGSTSGFEINENCGNNGLATSKGNELTDLAISYDLSNEMTAFWIIYNGEGFSDYSNPGWSCINENPDTGICNFLEYDPEGIEDYVYYYGLAEKIFGISEKAINSLDYEDLKDKWKFPQGADFQVAINNIETGEEIFRLDVETPYEQANVYVREWSDYILTEDGGKEAVKINMAVWR